MIINYNISPNDFVESSVLIDDVSRPYWVEDVENNIHDVYYAFSGRAIDHIEFTIDANINPYSKDALVEIVALTGMGANYFAFHLKCPKYYFVPELGEPDTMIFKFNGIIFTDNPYYSKTFRFRINIDGCEQALYYRIIYNRNGADYGTEPVDSYRYAPGEDGTILGNPGDLGRDEFYFIGWNTEPDGSGSGYTSGDTITVNENTVLFAMWEMQPLLVLTSNEDGSRVALKRLSRNQSMLKYSVDKGHTWYDMTLDSDLTVDSGNTVYLIGELDGPNFNQEYSIYTSTSNDGLIQLSSETSVPVSFYYSYDMGDTWERSVVGHVTQEIHLESGQTICIRNASDGCIINKTGNITLNTPDKNYYVYTSISNNGCIKLFRTNEYASSLWYSLDKMVTWVQLVTDVSSDYETISLTSGQTVYIRSISDNGRIETIGLDKHNSDYTSFKIDGNMAVSRYMNAMWNYRSLNEPLLEYCAYKLFEGCTGLTDASELVMLTEDLDSANNCYDSMFSGCTNLVNAPVLPATGLSEYCYHNMFYGCTNLSETPELIGQSLQNGCYSYMFASGVSLTNHTIPDRLPIEELKIACYRGMFAGCTGLAKSIQLPSMTLAPYCYANMFQGCTSLVDASGDYGELELQSTAAPHSCYLSMFDGCSTLSKIQSILPSFNVLGVSCYQSMYAGCAALEYGPELPSDTLSSSRVYQSMFYRCEKLKKIPIMPSYITASAYCSCMATFSGCISLTGITRELGLDNCGSYTINGIFNGCNGLTTAEGFRFWTGQNRNTQAVGAFKDCINLITPFKKFENIEGGYSHAYIFQNCVLLEETPYLGKFDRLGSKGAGHFQYAFSNCKSLKKTRGYFTETQYGCLNTWLSTGENEYIGLFNGCENLVETGVFFNEDPSDASSHLILKRQLTNWMEGCPSGLTAIDSGCTFYQSWDAVWDSTIERGPSTIPEGWTIVTALYYVSDVDLSELPSLATVTLVDASGNTHTGIISAKYCRYDEENEEGVLAYETRLNGEMRYDLKIKAFNNNLLKDNINVKWFYIPDTCDEIPMGAFSGCSSMVRTEIGRRVKIVREYAYYGGRLIEDWRQVVQDSEEYENYFLPLWDLKHFPDNIEIVERYAFYWCSRLPLQFTENSHIEAIGEGAFIECTCQGNLYLPSSLTQIGARAFASCKNISAVTINNLNATVDSTAFDDVTFGSQPVINGIVYYPDGEHYESSNYYATALGNTDVWEWKPISEIPQETN